jgi:hypothetical protein
MVVMGVAHACSYWWIIAHRYRSSDHCGFWWSQGGDGSSRQYHDGRGRNLSMDGTRDDTTKTLRWQGGCVWLCRDTLGDPQPQNAVRSVHATASSICSGRALTATEYTELLSTRSREADMRLLGSGPRTPTVVCGDLRHLAVVANEATKARPARTDIGLVGCQP